MASSLALLEAVVLMCESVGNVAVTVVITVTGEVLAGVEVGLVACASAVQGSVVTIVARTSNGPSESQGHGGRG